MNCMVSYIYKVDGKNKGTRGQSNWKIDSVGQRNCALLAEFTAIKVFFLFIHILFIRFMYNVTRNNYGKQICCRSVLIYSVGISEIWFGQSLVNEISLA